MILQDIEKEIDLLAMALGSIDTNKIPTLEQLG